MITVIGSLNIDRVTFTRNFPDAGETVAGNSFEEHLGGKGFNECVAAARLLPQKTSPPTVRMWGMVGSDREGQLFRDELENLQVDSSMVNDATADTGSATIIVQDGENRIIIIGGANDELVPTPEKLESVFHKEDDDGFVIIQNEFPNPEEVIDWLAANRPSVKIVYNPSPLRASSAEAMKKVHYLVLNEGEARKTYGEGHTGEDLSELVSRARKEAAKPTLIITLGSKGCIYQTPDEPSAKSGDYLKVPAHSVGGPIVDTTGAGDTFLGGLVAHLHQGYTLLDSLKFASAASSLAIQKRGASESIPTYDQVIPIL